MAKKSAKSASGGNKSQAIRDYLKQHSDVGPTAVAAALNAREGWHISAAYVSTIKNKVKPRGGRVTRAGNAKAGALDKKALLQAHELCKQAGGINQAKAALDLLAKLMT